VEHLAYILSLAILNNAAINISVQVPLLKPDLFLQCIPRSRIAGLYGSSMFRVLKSPVLFSIMAVLVYIPMRSA
jgi:hypothetical protein